MAGRALNYYPAAITQEEWDAARGEIAQRNRNPGRPSKAMVNLFAGRLYEARSGASYIMTQRQSRGHGGEPLYRGVVALTLGFSVDTDVRSKSTIFYKDVRAAAGAGKIMDHETAKMREELAKTRPNPDFPRYVIEDMESGQYTVNGDRIEVSHVLDRSLLVKIIKESR
jgi:hypothetical protein